MGRVRAHEFEHSLWCSEDSAADTCDGRSVGVRTCDAFPSCDALCALVFRQRSRELTEPVGHGLIAVAVLVGGGRGVWCTRRTCARQNLEPQPSALDAPSKKKKCLRAQRE